VLKRNMAQKGSEGEAAVLHSLRGAYTHMIYLWEEARLSFLPFNHYQYLTSV